MAPIPTNNGANIMWSKAAVEYAVAMVALAAGAVAAMALVVPALV
ncbi:hypothetical protein PQC31_gp02 [Pseudomonas phage Iggy]|uniref:Uncharacterized protein n=1 Tax=Pseudomonas phage Iggy TaxID=2592193 RepID=A0A7S5AZ35_9CAUD|nr:hypothetical protein PQC31_gp02 [Pseudomonas phage Iggy]QEA09723.1 hypothetical protein [Pseudomonas phage Iggy]